MPPPRPRSAPTTRAQHQFKVCGLCRLPQRAERGAHSSPDDAEPRREPAPAPAPEFGPEVPLWARDRRSMNAPEGCGGWLGAWPGTTVSRGMRLHGSGLERRGSDSNARTPQPARTTRPPHARHRGKHGPGTPEQSGRTHGHQTAFKVRERPPVARGAAWCCTPSGVLATPPRDTVRPWGPWHVPAARSAARSMPARNMPAPNPASVPSPPHAEGEPSPPPGPCREHGAQSRPTGCTLVGSLHGAGQHLVSGSYADFVCSSARVMHPLCVYVWPRYVETSQRDQGTCNAPPRGPSLCGDKPAGSKQRPTPAWCHHH